MRNMKSLKSVLLGWLFIVIVIIIMEFHDNNRCGCDFQESIKSDSIVYNAEILQLYNFPGNTISNEKALISDFEIYFSVGNCNYKLTLINFSIGDTIPIGKKINIKVVTLETEKNELDYFADAKSIR